jgi:hypothetical protein
MSRGDDLKTVELARIDDHQSISPAGAAAASARAVLSRIS